MLHLLVLLSVMSQSFSYVSTGQETLQFYAISCPTCELVTERVRILEETYPRGNFILYDIAEGENTERFKRVADLLNETLFLPLVGIFKDGELTAIASGSLTSSDWRTAVEEERDGVPVYVAISQGQLEILTIINEPRKLWTISRLFVEPDLRMFPDETDFTQLLLVVVTAAAMDAINPCSFNIFVVLLTFVFYGVGEKAVMKIGLAFSIGLFIAYFLLGLGLGRIIHRLPEIKYVISLVAAVFGILRIMEALGEKVKHLPDAFASRISTRIERVSDPRSGFGAGIVTGFLLLPCSSAPYFIVLSLLSERASLLSGLALLGIYNLIITVPFVAITVVVAGLLRSTMELKLWSLENRRWVNLIMGFGLVLLSLLNLLV